jgi:molybdenum cofactor synthesis domain-containing protein
MRPLGALLDFDAARRIALEAAVPVRRVERVRLADAAARVAAREVRARIDVPLADRAAMDGYAVRATDTREASPGRPVSLPRVGSVYAGRASRAAVPQGGCIEIATGAVLPRGADAVVRVEDTARDARAVLVRSPVSPRENVSLRGEDIRRGAVLVRSGDVLTPGRIGALAAVGTARVPVFARPRVAILTTGDEVVPPGGRIRPDQVYDINSHTLAALVRDHGGEPVLRRRAPDRLDALRAALRAAAASADLVVATGGSSVGTRDLLVDALDEVRFHGIAIKPGRPTALGRIRRTVVLGMPGFPASCLSNGYVLLAPMVRRMARRPPAVERTVEAPLAAPIDSPAGKVEVHAVRLEDGRAVSASRESSAISSMAYAHGYVVIPADVTRLEAGATVRVVLF